MFVEEALKYLLNDPKESSATTKQEGKEIISNPSTDTVFYSVTITLQ